MMQLDSHIDGGRSSNLSPLAPPFTLDESNCNHSHEFQPYNTSLSEFLILAASDRYGNSPYESNMIAVEDADSVPGKDTSDDLLGNFGVLGKSRGSVDLELSRVWRGMSNEEKRNWLKNLGGSVVPQDCKPHPPPIPSGVWNGMSVEEQCELLRYFGGKLCVQDYKHAQIDPEASHLRNGLSVEQRNSMNRDGSCVSKPRQPWIKREGISESHVETPVKSKNWSDVLPYHSFGLNFEARSDAGNADNFLTRSPSPIRDYNVKYKQGNEDHLDQVVHAEYVPSSPHLSVAGCLQKRSNTGFSKEILSDCPQIQNPAVESNCSKGGLAARFSPVEDSKLVHPDGSVEKLEVHENNSSIKSSDANNICKFCDSRLKINTGVFKKKINTGMKLYPGDGFRSLEKNNGLDDALENEPSFASSTQSLQINLVDHEAVPVEKNYELKGECVDLAASRRISCSTANVSDEILHSPSENLSASKANPFGKDLHSKVDFGMLINTMKTLSEELVDRCLSSGIRPAELYNIALKDIIINLNSCLVKEIDQVTQLEKAVDPQQGTHSLGDAQQSPMVRKITTTNTDPHGFDILGDVQHPTLSSGNEGALDSSFLKDDAETFKDIDTVQAIKRALNLKFPSDELHPETVLYKNLWLEAEASLCATNVTSRFKSLQKEMEIQEYYRMNDEENIPNPETCAVNAISEPSIQAVNSLDSSILNCPANMDSSVVARFQTPESNANDIEASLKHHTEDEKVPSGNSEIPPSSNPSQDSCLSSIYGHMGTRKNSLMSRLNVLKSWTGHPDSPLHMDAHRLPEPVDEPTLSSSIYAQNRSSDYVQSEGEGVEDCLGGSVAYNPGEDKFFEEWEHVDKEDFP